MGVGIIQDVPGFDFIRIHTGKNAADTKGCILVGDKWDKKSPNIEYTRTEYHILINILFLEQSSIRICITDSIGRTVDDVVHPPKGLFDLSFSVNPPVVA